MTNHRPFRISMALPHRTSVFLATSFLTMFLPSTPIVAQIKPPDLNSPTLPTIKLPTEIAKPQLPASEVYNECDKQVLDNDPANGSCREAIPPLNSGDCLGSQGFCVYQQDHSHLIAYPNRRKIVDAANNTVVIRGEALVDGAMIFAKDRPTLEGLLAHTEIQALIGKTWTTKRTLLATDYAEISNLRTYQFSDCGKAFAKFKKDWDSLQKLEVLVHEALSKPAQPNAPRPDPSFLLRGVPSGPTSPTGDPSEPSSSRGGLPPPPPGSEAGLRQDMLDAAIEKSVKDLNAVTENRPSCPAKTLPYYWTMVVVRYSPELNETQIRLHVNSDLTGKKDFALTKAFKVYLAASQPHAMPTKDGDREFSFEVFASGDVSFGASGQASVVYDQDTLSSTAHRASASVTTPIEVIINSRSVKRWRAAGRFPFTKSFWDDVRSRDVSQTVSQQGDLNPIAIKGDARVAYRMEVGTSPTAFVSGSATFTMPPPLTFALLGDSYSAGQGAPILSKLEGPWLDDDCHRSRSSGQYIAVNQFIKASNKACDYLFKACEGAVIQDVIDQAQRTKHEPDGTTHGDLKQSKAQVDLVRDWMTEKGYSHLNVALFGIGGNNSGFEPAIEAAIIGWEPFGEYGWKDGTDNQKLRSQVDAGFAYINGANGYKRIDTVMRDRLKVGDIIIFGYPDVTHNSDGTICKTDCSDPPEGSTSTNIVPHSISAEELGYGDTVMSRLTAAVGLAGKLPGWHYVDIFHATKNRGICACQNICLTTWTVATTPGPVNFACVRGKGAMINGASCSFHPNGRGYQLYVAPILAQLVSLYGN